jgi:pseudaminic acid synthase
LRNVSLLHCVSSYPTLIGDAYLSQIKNWRAWNGGISDHTTERIIPIAATALGACIIEKHLMLHANDPTEDAAFSLLPHAFGFTSSSVWYVNAKLAWFAMQPPTSKAEESSRQLRRSLYAVADIKVGEALTTANVRSIRPAYGLPPKELPNVLGKKAATDIERGTALAWELLA